MAATMAAGVMQSPCAEDAWAAYSHAPYPASAPVATLGAPELAQVVLIGVGEAAGRLGVHENTIRNWIDRGILRAIRLPGSRHRRVNRADVDAVRASLLGQLASPALAGGRDIEGESRSSHHVGGERDGFMGSPHEGW